MRRFLVLVLLAGAIALVALIVRDGNRGDRADRAPDDPSDPEFVKRTVPEVPSTASHRGRVINEAGDPIAGVQVHAIEPLTYASDTALVTRTNERGEFGLILAQPEGLVLIFRKSGFIPGIHPPASDLEVTLRAGESITGRVVDDSRLPIEDAWVVVRADSVTHAVATGEDEPCPGPDAVRFARATCDPDGFFEIPGLDPGTAYRVTAMAPGHAMARDPARGLPGEIGEIRLRSIYVAVFGLRRNGVDVTPGVRWGSYMHGARVNYPDGYQRAFFEFPRDRFPASIDRRLRELAGEGGVSMVCTSQPRTEPEILTPHLGLRVVVDGRAARYATPMIPIGKEGWDRRTWIDLPEEDSEAPGTVVVRNERDPHARFRLSRLGWSGLGADFDTRYDPERQAQIAIVPPGEYELVWHPDPGIRGTRRWKAIVRSGELTETPVNFGRAYVVKFDPRLSTGGEARELALEVTVPMAMRLMRYSFPHLCVDGPESIQIAPEHDDQGWLRLVAHKPGYEKVTGAVKFGDEDLTWSPILKASPLPAGR